MQPRRLGALLLTAIGATGPVASPLLAHHSIAGAYETDRQVRIQGVVSEFRFVSPHPFLIVTVGENPGATQWQLEMDNRRELARIGMDASTLEPGDSVVVVGSPARREARRLYIRRLDRPLDGFAYEQVGGSPRIRSR